MKKALGTFSIILLLLSCNREDGMEPIPYDNPEVPLDIPIGFPSINPSVGQNKPTKYGVELGEKLFHEKKFSTNNMISCASCHNRSSAFADNEVQAVGVY